MAINQWPEAERPREKLLQMGAEALSDAELLAIFLRTGVAGKTAVDLARDLLGRFGSLRELLTASQDHFCDAKGLGVAKYTQLQAVVEMARRHLLESVVRDSALESPEQVKDYLRSQLRDRRSEVFACLFLDSQHRVISFDEMFYGTIDGAAVYPREVVRRAIRHNAAAVILSHNHPSGVAEPSKADIAITNRLQSGLELVDVRVVDHIVVGDPDMVSFAERGLL